MSTSLLKIQIGPVQDFIAQARSTRDLWSGSYLLSWLMAHALRKLANLIGGNEAAREAVIYPSLHDQPLFAFLGEGASSRIPRPLCLTPNLPNLLVARLPGGEALAASWARQMEESIREEWRNIATACWRKLADPSNVIVDGNRQGQFDRQTNHFLSIAWLVTPGADDYAQCYRLNGWELDAVRQTRDFNGWASGGWQAGQRNNKDSLSGREEAICGGTEWWNAVIKPLYKSNPTGFWPMAFRERQAGDWYGAVSLIKRLWYRDAVYLPEQPWQLSVWKYLQIPSTRQVARHDPEKNEEDDNLAAPADESSYFAVLAMDGDEMGKWLSGAKGMEIAPERHRDFSAKLSDFALNHARQIVRKHDGALIYSGGDDVLALLPADTAIACAQDLRSGFRSVMRQDMDASVGIAIAHFKEPLQDLVRAAQDAEKYAKTRGNRSSLAVSLFKHSGETVHWHCRWATPENTPSGLGLFGLVRTGLALDRLSAKFPHRVIELLTPYLLDPAEEGRRLLQPAQGFPWRETIEQEFWHVLQRQRGPLWQDDFASEVMNQLRGYLDQLDAFLDADDGKLDTNAKLNALIGLCKTVAFVSRNDKVAPDTTTAASTPLQPLP